MSPMTRREIREAILFRHRMGGMEFVYKGKKEEALSENQLRSLFQKYHRLSDGEYWDCLTSMESKYSITGGACHQDRRSSTGGVSGPEKPGMEAVIVSICNPQEPQQNTTYAVIPAKKSKLDREQMEDLIRSQLILEPTKNVFTLNPKSRPYVEGWLKELQILEMKEGER